MTWIQQIDYSIAESAQIGESRKIDDEVFPGVVFERRSVLRLSALAAATLLFGSSDSHGDEVKDADKNGGHAEDELSWEEFLEMCVPLAKPLYKNKSAAGKDEYLFKIASKAILLDDVPIGKLRQFRKFDPKYEFELAHQGFPFIVIHWRMEPNAILPAHCHPGTSVCTLGLEGETLVRHFEPVGDAPDYNSKKQRPFQIRETKSQLISPKRVSTLSDTRDNIHYFVAGPDGARGIDITTHYESDGSFSFLKFDAEKPIDRKKQLYEANWVGSDLQHNF